MQRSPIAVFSLKKAFFVFIRHHWYTLLQMPEIQKEQELLILYGRDKIELVDV